jgi:lipid-A-disaccharide synthase
VVARAPNLADRLFEPFGIPGATIRIVEGQTDDVLNGSDAVVTASGTATVQTALHGKPMVVLYKLSPMTYRLGRRLALVDMYAMVNLIAGRRIVVELIQDGCTPEAVATETTRLLTDSGYRSQMVAAIEDVKARLGGPGASDRAAAAILEVPAGSVAASRHHVCPAQFRAARQRFVDYRLWTGDRGARAVERRSPLDRERRDGGCPSRHEGERS